MRTVQGIFFILAGWPQAGVPLHRLIVDQLLCDPTSGYSTKGTLTTLSESLQKEEIFCDMVKRGLNYTKRWLQKMALKFNLPKPPS